MVEHGVNEETVRRQIMNLLKGSKHPLTVDEIALILGYDLNPAQVYDHLKHIAKTVRRESGGRLALVMRPPVCRKCGYVFKDIKKPRAPSKCPRCHSQWIEPPAFLIIEA